MSHSQDKSKNKKFDDAIEQALEMLMHLTSESLDNLASLSPEEIIAALAYTLNFKKEELNKLFYTHNQSLKLDIAILAKLWKLVSAGVIKKDDSHLAKPKKVTENIDFMLLRRNELISINGLANVGPASLAMITSAQPSKSAKISMNKVGDWALKAFIANGNNNLAARPSAI